MRCGTGRCGWPWEHENEPPDLVTRLFTATRPNQGVGGGPGHVATWGLRARRVRDQRVRPPDRRLAGIEFAAQRPGAQRAGAAAAKRSGWPRRALSRRSGARGVCTATRWPSPSSGGTRLKRSAVRGPWGGVEDVEFATLE